MPSGVRARARAERERSAAEAAAERAVRDAAVLRRRQRLDRLGDRIGRLGGDRIGRLARSLSPSKRGRQAGFRGDRIGRLARSLSLSKRGRQAGTLLARRRLQVRLLLVVLLVLNALLWLAEPSWAVRVLALVASVLVAPVLYTVLFRKA